MNEPTVTFTRSDGLGVVTLNRPQAGNTINMVMARELEAQVDRAIADPAVRAVVLTGAGRLFCGGGDISAFAAAGDRAGDFLFEIAHALHRSVKKLAVMAKPMITLVNGPAAGAGLSLAIAGDLVLAAPSAHFTAAYSGVGLTPDGGASWLLPRLVGLRRAQDMIFTNRRVDVEEAVQIGLVTRLVARDTLMSEGLAAARALAEGPVGAFGGTRALLAASFHQNFANQLDLEAACIAQAGDTDEAREGISAFLERRKPDFSGQA